ncbi:MAG: methyltransferase [Leptospiraceae bacterium]|nr:methyltransferase [Leptospiraceae bacterium]MDW7976760.1 methyltransferase [Leptospiraceae bacterium]
MTKRSRTLKWVQNGYVLTYYNDKPFFIHGALPQEEIRFRIIKENKHIGFGFVEEVLFANPSRIENDCSVFPICGGCSFRNISYQDEINIKIELLKEFPTIKRILDSVAWELFFSPFYQYRNQAKIHFRNQKKGFFQILSNEIVGLPEEGCRNLPRELNEFIKTHLPYSHQKEQKLFFIHDQVYVNQEFEIRLPKKNWKLSTDCFLQTNRFLIRSWLDWIQNQIQNHISKKDLRVMDLFCGTGLISGSFNDEVSYVEGYESNPISLAYARRNFEKLKKKHKFFQVDLYQKPISIPNDFNVVIVNPPRNGIGKKLLKSLGSASIPILYSSCNPATFERDVKVLMANHYEPISLAIFDFFPRTPHLELVAFFRKLRS